MSDWRSSLALLRGLPLLPVHGKAPINPETGFGLRGWQHASFDPEQISRSQHATGAGLRVGPDCELICFDIDGASSFVRLAQEGCDSIDTWVIGRTGTRDRVKVIFKTTAEQRELLGIGKASLITHHDQEARVREAIEVFHGIGQVVICGQHPDGDDYCWVIGSPAEVRELPQAWFSLASRILQHATVPATPTTPRRGARGLRKLNPCPICGRDKHLACAETTEGRVLCVDGDSFGFSLRHGTLRPGQTIRGLDGNRWAFLSGNVSPVWGIPLGVFKIDQPRTTAMPDPTAAFPDPSASEGHRDTSDAAQGPAERRGTPPPSGTPSGGTSGGTTHRQQPQPKRSAFDQARSRLKAMIADGLSGSALAAKVAEFSEEYGCSLAAMQRIAAELEAEGDAEIDADAQLQAIQEAATAKEARKGFTLELLLPQPCVEPLRYLSTGLQVDDLATAMIFMTCVSGTLKAGTRIWGNKLTFAERPQIWLGVVADSGDGKSPAIRDLGLHHLALVSAHYRQRNEDRMAAWELVNAGVTRRTDRTPQPDPYVLILRNYTGGALVKQFATNEAERLGILLAPDELKSLFTSLNEFQDSGKGSEQEQLLSLYDNNGDAQIRVRDGVRSYEEGHLSIIGGIQHEVFHQLAAKGDPTGLFARLLLLTLVTDEYRGDEEPEGASIEKTLEMQRVLEDVVLRASELQPRAYYLDESAVALHKQIRRDAYQLGKEAFLKAHKNIYSKRSGYVLRVAGVMHILKVACGELQEDALITSDTLLAALQVVSHLQGDALTAHKKAAQLGDGHITDLMKWLHAYALKKGETSAGRFRADALTPKKRRLYPITTVNHYVERLVAAGFAEWCPGSSRNGGRRFRATGSFPD